MSRPRPDVPGWDWNENDYSWLASRSGIICKDGTSIFFIHGGRIRHQARLPHGHHTLEHFIDLLREHAEGLDDPNVVWLEDTGGGDPGLWVEGTRLPNDEDLGRLQDAREKQERKDRQEFAWLKRKHSDWFTQGGGESVDSSDGTV